MSDEIRAADVIELAAVRAQGRSHVYRERAAQLRRMAESETIDRVRDNLLNLADQYDGLAVRLAAGDYAWPERLS